MNVRHQGDAVGSVPGPADRGPLAIDVEWADIVHAEGNVLVAGQYMGVRPQNAVLALDRLISGTEDQARLVLTGMTRRGAIRSAVGDVNFFPCPGRRHVVLVGMGRQGFFSEPQLVKVVRCMAEAVGGLLRRPRVCTVLIGTGAGNLDVHTAVGGMVAGFVSALQADPRLEFAQLRIVERDLDRAYEIVDALKERADDSAIRGKIVVSDAVVERPRTGGMIPLPFGYSLMLASIARACAEGDGNDLYATAQALVGKLPAGLKDEVLKALTECGVDANLSRAGLKFRISEGRGPRDPQSSDRLSFFQDGRQIRTAAMTNLATVTERVLAMKCKWIDRIIDDLHAAVPPGIEDRSIMAYGHLIHQDVREKVVAVGPLVIEVDRRLARVPWEMLHDDVPDRVPLGVHRPLARQLRTMYSPRVAAPPLSGGLRALVIGDPDDSLAAARREAVAVWALLKARDIAADLCLGAPDELGLGRHKVREDGSERVADPADLFKVMERLQSGRYDLVHFAGHAAFSDKAPDMSGWLFADREVLTPAMLENLERPPLLIFANACLSASVSPGESDEPEAAGAEARAKARDIQRRGDALLVASLADEFLRRGVADYIGTAWEVPDQMAGRFAEVFYGRLLEDDEATLGEAVQAARRELYEHRDDYGAAEAVWAAYQHYGDPTRKLKSERAAS